MDAHVNPIKEDTNLTRPILYGLIAAILGGAFWAAVTIISEWDLGIVAILAAALISWAVLQGANQVRSVKLQVVAIVMTVLAVFIAHFTVLVYYILKRDGYESQLLTAMWRLTTNPKYWGDIIHYLPMSIGPVGWLIIAIALYTAYTKTSPRILPTRAPMPPAGHPTVGLQAAEINPVEIKNSGSASEIKFDNKIFYQVTALTFLYLLSISVSLIVAFGTTSLPELTRAIIFIVLILLSGFAARRTQMLKRKYPQQFLRAEKANKRLSLKRILIGSIAGVIGIFLFLLILGQALQ